MGLWEMADGKNAACWRRLRGCVLRKAFAHGGLRHREHIGITAGIRRFRTDRIGLVGDAEQQRSLSPSSRPEPPRD